MEEWKYFGHVLQLNSYNLLQEIGVVIFKRRFLRYLSSFGHLESTKRFFFYQEIDFYIADLLRNI